MKIGHFPAVKLVDALPGANGRNSLFGGVRVVRSHSNMPGVAAQEVYEWRCKASWFGLGSAALAAAALVPYTLLTALCLVVAGFAVSRIATKRGRELMSHAIEIQAGLLVGTVTDLHAYEAIESESMARGYDHLAGMNAAAILLAMRERYPEAQMWVRKNESRLRELATAANSTD